MADEEHLRFDPPARVVLGREETIEVMEALRLALRGTPKGTGDWLAAFGAYRVMVEAWRRAEAGEEE